MFHLGQLERSSHRQRVHFCRLPSIRYDCDALHLVVSLRCEKVTILVIDGHIPEGLAAEEMLAGNNIGLHQKKLVSGEEAYYLIFNHINILVYSDSSIRVLTFDLH